MVRYVSACVAGAGIAVHGTQRIICHWWHDHDLSACLYVCLSVCLSVSVLLLIYTVLLLLLLLLLLLRIIPNYVVVSLHRPY